MRSLKELNLTEAVILVLIFKIFILSVNARQCYWGRSHGRHAPLHNANCTRFGSDYCTKIPNFEKVGKEAVNRYGCDDQRLCSEPVCKRMVVPKREKEYEVCCCNTDYCNSMPVPDAPLIAVIVTLISMVAVTN